MLTLLALQVEQEAYKEKYGEYFQARGADSKAYNTKEKVAIPSMSPDQTIHEHLCPDGSRGFTLFSYRVSKGGVKEMKAEGIGCGSQTFDWMAYEDKA